jgi:hypothetical protein
VRIKKQKMPQRQRCWLPWQKNKEGIPPAKVLGHPLAQSLVLVKQGVLRQRCTAVNLALLKKHLLNKWE